MSSMLPVPLAVEAAVRRLRMAVNVAPPSVLGRVSTTEVPVAVAGPGVGDHDRVRDPWPGTAVPIVPVTLDPPRLSVLVISRSACGVSVSVSVALLLAVVVVGIPSNASSSKSPSSVLVTPTGGVTVAVFDSVPVADERWWPCSVYVTVLPAGKIDVGVVDAAGAAWP